MPKPLESHSQPQGHPPWQLKNTSGIVLPGLRKTPPRGKWKYQDGWDKNRVRNLLVSWRWQSPAVKSSSDLQQEGWKVINATHMCVCFGKLDPIVYKQMFLSNLIGLSYPDTMLLLNLILRQRKMKQTKKFFKAVLLLVLCFVFVLNKYLVYSSACAREIHLIR